MRTFPTSVIASGSAWSYTSWLKKQHGASKAPKKSSQINHIHHPALSLGAEKPVTSIPTSVFMKASHCLTPSTVNLIMVDQTWFKSENIEKSPGWMCTAWSVPLVPIMLLWPCNFGKITPSACSSVVLSIAKVVGLRDHINHIDILRINVSLSS